MAGGSRRNSYRWLDSLSPRGVKRAIGGLAHSGGDAQSEVRLQRLHQQDHAMAARRSITNLLYLEFCEALAGKQHAAV